MPADNIRVLVVKLSMAGCVDTVARVLRDVPDVDGMSHDLKLTVKTIFIILPDQ